MSELTCHKCGKVIRVMYRVLRNKFPTCVTCFDEMFPSGHPKLGMVLSVISHGASGNFHIKKRLYNSTLSVHEHNMALEDFLNCGWFLRKEVIRKEVRRVHLEYYGKTKCGRFPDHEFPGHYKDCKLSSTCRRQASKYLTNAMNL